MARKPSWNDGVSIEDHRLAADRLVVQGVSAERELARLDALLALEEAPEADRPRFPHAALCAVAYRFLLSQRVGCTFAVVEPVTAAASIPDAVGWGFRGECHQVEVKVSRSDFFADRRKLSRLADCVVGTHRWYLVPAGMVAPDEVPPEWGLTYVAQSGSKLRTRVVREAPRVEPSPGGLRDERVMLAGLLRRLRDGGKIDPETGRITTWRDLSKETS